MFTLFTTIFTLHARDKYNFLSRYIYVSLYKSVKKTVNIVNNVNIKYKMSRKLVEN